MNVEIKNGVMNITGIQVPDKLPLSSTGKTFLLAKENDKGKLQHEGKPVTVQLNAYVPNPNYVAPPKA